MTTSEDSTGNQTTPDAGQHPTATKRVPAKPESERVPEEVALEIRKLAHDLSNALEIIVQTSYLLSTVGLKEPGSAWLEMLESGVTKALDINLALRQYIKSHTSP